MNSILKGLKRVDTLEVKDKKVFLRLDLNVPLKDGHVADDTRILAALPTIQYLKEKGAKLVISSHLGRPKSPEDIEFSLEPVAKRLSELLNLEVVLLDNPEGQGIKGLFPGMKDDQIFLLENLRFAPGEEKNDRELAQRWAQWAEVYVNDAFGASHRAHASIDALPRLMTKKALGFLMFTEIEKLSQLIENAPRPYYALLGGSKVSDKIDLIENMIERVDGFLIGGAMSYTFLQAQGISVGASRVEKEKVRFAGELMGRMEARGKKIYLPEDHLIAENFGSNTPKATSGASIEDGWMALDIGPKTIRAFSQVLKEAKTVFWNGPMGVFERPVYSKGTFAMAKVLSELEGALTVVGGGDSASAAQQSGFANKMAHISTGGGASLEFLQGEKLPGVEACR
jgi:phosphoglycerate kinase